MNDDNATQDPMQGRNIPDIRTFARDISGFNAWSEAIRRPAGLANSDPIHEVILALKLRDFLP